jgi:hypothetical protein
MDINTKKEEKAYGNSLKHRVSEVWRREVLDASPLLPAGQMPEGRMSAFVNHTYADLYRNLWASLPTCPPAQREESLYILDHFFLSRQDVYPRRLR